MLDSRYFAISRDLQVSQFDSLEEAHEKASEMYDSYIVVGVENYCVDGPLPVTTIIDDSKK